ncbi:MAG: hypothetical protein ACRYGO_09665 [Janthinobacterium lividum]
MKPIPTETATDVGSVGKWLGAAAAGALLMYLLDPERGSARRSRAWSTLRDAGARTGATVDGALHSAGERLVDLKDSAADALARGTGRLQAQAAPLLERAHDSASAASGRIAAEASHARARIADEAERARDRLESERSRSHVARSRYEHDERYDGRYTERYGAHGHGERREGGLTGWLQDLGDRLGDTLGASRGQNSALLGGGMLGLLGLMRRSPAGLLVGLAGLALLMRGSGTQRYSVGSLSLPSTRHAGASAEPAPHLPSAAPSASPSGSGYLH